MAIYTYSYLSWLRIKGRLLTELTTKASEIDDKIIRSWILHGKLAKDSVGIYLKSSALKFIIPLLD